MLVEESASRKLNWAARFAGDRLLLSYLEDCKDVLYVHDLKSTFLHPSFASRTYTGNPFRTGKQLYKLPLDIGSVSGVFAREEETELFYRFESDLNPGAIYALDFKGHKDDTQPPPTKVFSRPTRFPSG